MSGKIVGGLLIALPFLAVYLVTARDLGGWAKGAVIWGAALLVAVAILGCLAGGIFLVSGEARP